MKTLIRWGRWLAAGLASAAMILATVHFRFAVDLDLDGDLPFALSLARLSLPDLLRLPSTERPPASIIAA